jgi:signal transduction histidine kinase
MNAVSASSAAGAPVPPPLPLRQFQRFITVFHFVFLGGLALILALRWRQPGFAWRPQDTALLALVLLQAGLYLRFFLRPPPQWRWWAVHFVAGFGIWLAEWRLEAAYEWVGLAYLGQMFGVLPPRYSLPAATAVFAAYLSEKFGWDQLTHLGGWMWFGLLSVMGAWSALGLFLHRLATTSSERARLIQELQAAQRELEAARQRETELAALRERERLARDLHDSLGHALVTLTVQLEAAQRLLLVDPIRARTTLELMKALTRAATDDLRRSLANLRTPGLGDRSLTQALGQLVAEAQQRAGLAIDCQVAAAADRLQPSVAEALWRVAQEGMANVEQHAQATKVSLHLTAQRDEIVLRISDDGVGLPADGASKPGHFGLRGLRERVEGLGGTFTAASGKAGAVLEARLPIPGST